VDCPKDRHLNDTPIVPAGLADAVEAARLRLLSAGLLGRRGVSLALAGSGRDAGVSTLAVGLADSLVRHGMAQVLLVDGTPLGHRAKAMLGWQGPPMPAPDLSLTVDQLAKVVQRPQACSFDLLALADAPGPSLRESAGDAWGTLCGRYDAVIVDAGAITTDTPFRWSAWVDNIALVLDTMRVTREALGQQRRALDGAGLRLSGFILNKRKFHVPASLYRVLG
jgi:Mrp family chromosome partitioning ATPase